MTQGGATQILTVGVVPRDRYCLTADAIGKILDRTRIPFDRAIVDNGIPETFRRKIAPLIEGRPGTRIVRADGARTSNAAKNSLVEAVSSDFVCIIESDVFVHDDWLSPLLEACRAEPAEAAVPLILEPQLESDKVHFDDRLGHIERVAGPDGEKLAILPRRTPKEADRTASRRRVDFVETHCVLYRRSVFDRIGPFDESLRGSRAEIDMSLSLHDAGARAVLEPRSRVTFAAPPPVHPEERAYFKYQWDPEAAARDHRRMIEKWNLVECPSAVGFAKSRVRLAEEADPEAQVRHHNEYLSRSRRAARELVESIPDGVSFILVDDANWRHTEFAGRRHVFPFIERNGAYWGPPESDAVAVEELERLRGAGASYIAFGWPAFWWIDHYKGFTDYIRKNYDCVRQTDQLVVYDLNP